MVRARDSRALRWIVAAAALVVVFAVFALVSTPLRPSEARGPARTTNSSDTPRAEPVAMHESPSEERVAMFAASSGEEPLAVDVSAPSELAGRPEVSPRSFWGRVTDANGGAPIFGAIVTASGSRERWRISPQVTFELPSARSDAQGVFELRIPSDAQRPAWVRAPGFGPVYFALTDAHATPERALEIALSRAGEIEFHVREGARTEVPEAHIRVWARASNLAWPEGAFVRDEDPEWNATTDWMGSARIVDLPPDIPLGVEVSLAGVDKSTRFQDIVLSRGELRTCELELGTGTRITGMLLAQDGRSLPRQKLWITNTLASNWKQRASCFLDMQDRERVFATVTTDDQGRFEIGGVPRGRWWLGPAPRPPRSVRRVPGGRSALMVPLDESDPQLDSRTPCSVATMIEVDGMRPLDLTLRVQCGLYITGRVLDLDGQSISPSVHAHGLDVGGPVDAYITADGSFMVGPLPVGRFALWADGVRGLADSAEVLVEAGARDVELRLRESCEFVGRLTGVDTSESEYHVFAVNAVGIALCPLRDDGSFELGGMAPGKYDLVAAGLNGWFGAARGVLFESGERAEPVAIPMRPGARVRVRYEGPAANARLKIYDGESLVAFASVSQGASSLCTVPPGRLRVEVRLDESSLQKRELDLTVGEEAQVEFKFD